MLTKTSNYHSLSKTFLLKFLLLLLDVGGGVLGLHDSNVNSSPGGTYWDVQLIGTCFGLGLGGWGHGLTI